MPSAGSIIFSTFLGCSSKSKASSCSQPSPMLMRKAVVPRRELSQRWPRPRPPRTRKRRRLLEETRPLRRVRAVNKSNSRNSRRESQQRKRKVPLHRMMLQQQPLHPKKRRRSNHKRNKSRSNSRSLRSQRLPQRQSFLTSHRWISVLERLSNAGIILTVKSLSVRKSTSVMAR